MLEEHQLGQKIFGIINDSLRARGLMLREGTMVDATFIEAPTSIRNPKGERDPEMRHGKKGNTWHFGMKANIGADADSGLVHTVVVTGAHEADINQVGALLHGDERALHGDAGYTGVEKRKEHEGRKIDYHIATRPGTLAKLALDSRNAIIVQIEHAKARIRARVEHPFHVIKNLFHHRKTRYRGLAKNNEQLHAMFGVANLMLAKRRILALPGIGAP